MLAAHFLIAIAMAYLRLRAGNQASQRHWMSRTYALMISLTLVIAELIVYLTWAATGKSGALILAEVGLSRVIR